jgi:hypothetical protein
MNELLNLIENVDPSDKGAMDEIDARVWCWLNGYKFAAAKHDRIFVIDEYQCEIEKLNGLCTLKYTRSRDALKSIRPDGWWPIKLFKDGHVFRFELTDGSRIASSAWLETEELAELHAIIQAISFEREKVRWM